MTKREPTFEAPNRPGTPPPASRRARRQTVQSVEIGIGVLRALAASGHAAPLGAIAAAAGMPPAKAHRYLQSLSAAGFVEQAKAAGVYRLGPEALRIGLAALDALDIVQLADGHLARLAADLGESCFLAVPANAGPTVVRIEQPPRSITIAVRLGSVLPDLASATGLCFAAFGRMPSPEPDADRMAAIRRAGSASVQGTVMAGVDAVSAPVFDHAGRLCGAVTALAASGALDVRAEGVASCLVRASANALGHDLGHRGGTAGDP